jgi:hypothetical protein
VKLAVGVMEQAEYYEVAIFDFKPRILKHSVYPVSTSRDRLSFTFESVSSEKVVRKKVQFVLIADGLYNLAFGDVSSRGELDDLVVTDNKDMYEVLATVIQILRIFLELHPDEAIYVKGSTPSRTRLYQIILTKEISDWNDKFVVFGIENGIFIPFEPDRHFDSFIIKLKKQL